MRLGRRAQLRHGERVGAHHVVAEERDQPLLMGGQAVALPAVHVQAVVVVLVQPARLTRVGDADHAAVDEVEQGGREVELVHRAHAPQAADHGRRQLGRQLANVLLAEGRLVLPASGEEEVEEQDDEPQRDEQRGDVTGGAQPVARLLPVAGRVRLAGQARLLVEHFLEARPGERLDLGQRVGREQHARLDELLGRQVVDHQTHAGVRLYGHDPVQGPMRPGAHLTARHALGKVQRHVDVPGGRVPAAADELPVQLGRVLPALGGAQRPILERERRLRVRQPEERLHEHLRALRGHQIRPRRPRRSKGGGRLRQRAVRPADAGHLDALRALRVEVPVDACEAAVEAQRALLGHHQVAVGHHARVDADVGDGVAFGQRGGRQRPAHGENGEDGERRHHADPAPDAPHDAPS